MEAAAKALHRKLTDQKTQRVLAGWLKKKEREERDTDDRREGSAEMEASSEVCMQHARILELRQIMDTNQVSEAVATQLFACLGIRGVSGNATKIAREALDDVITDAFHIHTDAERTWVEPREAVIAAMEIADHWHFKPDIALVGDGRTMGAHTQKTTTYVALRLVRVRRDGVAASEALPKEKIIPLAILNTGEKYGPLEELLSELSEKLKDLQENGFEHEACGYKPRFWLCGDMKWLNMVTGCAAPKDACLHCHCTRKERWDCAESWGISRKWTDTKEQGHPRAALFSFIPPHRCMLDFLHLHLRIGERLIANCCAKLLAVGGVEHSVDDKERKTQGKWLTEALGPQIEELAHLAEGSVKFVFKDKQWQVSPKLTGNRLRPVLAGLDFEKIDALRRTKGWTKVAPRLQHAVDEFVAIFAQINRSNPFEVPGEEKLSVEEQADALELRVQQWVKECTREKTKKGMVIAPALFPPQTFCASYVHSLQNHVPELLRMWGDLYEFAGQEFEKENNEHNLMWFRCSSRRDAAAALEPILLATLRRLYNTSAKQVKQYMCPHDTCTKQFVGPTTCRNHLRAKHPETPVPVCIKPHHVLMARATNAQVLGERTRKSAVATSFYAK
jgi:hypothetical protein